MTLSRAIDEPNHLWNWGRLVSDDELKSVQPDGAILGTFWCRDQTHPAILAGSRSYLSIESESASVLDRVCTQAFHGRARSITIERGDLLAANLNASRKPENVVHPA